MSIEEKIPVSKQAGDALERKRIDQPREICSEDLLRDSRAVRIRHRGDVYTLRHTVNGKLILTK